MKNSFFFGDKAPLITLLKPSILKYLNSVWLTGATTQDILKIFNNNNLYKFIESEIHKLTSLTENDIDDLMSKGFADYR